MTIIEMYGRLNLPPNLQEHMLRVGAVIRLMVDSWKGPEVDKKAVVLAGLTHDLANIIKFDFSKPSMMGDEAVRVDYWRKVQQEVIEKYGKDIHLATLAMAREVGMSEEVVDLVAQLDWDRAEKAVEIKDWEVMMGIYADMRVGPIGVMTVEERIDNLHSRRPMKRYLWLKEMAHRLEEELQQQVTVKLDEIDDEAIEERFSELRRLSIYT